MPVGRQEAGDGGVRDLGARAGRGSDATREASDGWEDLLVRNPGPLSALVVRGQGDDEAFELLGREHSLTGASVDHRGTPMGEDDGNDRARGPRRWGAPARAPASRSHPTAVVSALPG